MNNIYFACTSCRIFVDAGYRWAHWTLEEPGVVKRGSTVDPSNVLSTEEYWQPGKDQGTNWLYEEVLPSVRRFLTEHANHAVVFGEEEDFLDFGSTWFLEWIQEGFLAELLPRTCLERLNLESWEAVARYVATWNGRVSWWINPDQREIVERWYKARLLRNQLSG